MYCGLRVGDTPVVFYLTLDGETNGLLDPRLDLWNHSPAGFNWGYCGSGPAQLALALLAHATEDDSLAIRLHQRFKREVVGRFQEESWSLGTLAVLRWACQAAEDVIADINDPVESERGGYVSQ